MEMLVWPRILILSLFLVLITYIPSVFSQTDSDGIAASTDKPTYKPAEKITITGRIKDVTSGNPVTILIRSPLQNVYNVGQVDLQNGVFVHSFVISDNSKPGVYNVVIKHGDQFTKLQFTISTGLVQNIPVGDSSIKVRGGELGLIKYKNVRVSIVDNAITIQLELTPGLDHSVMQEFEIPKVVIDSPESLTVEVNGEILKCSETETNVARILNCLIPLDARELRLIGTSVIPEYGPIAVLILIVGTSIIIGLSAKLNPRQRFY